ncbi:uncharacterized protein LOC114333788 [Diabrotica virgifera virgifera]|uniref:Uncharacterized protein n=1 Tax=Diabrotica virgifera virgifera TaxID=50390 RepID=A0ABM5KFA7_DIAVI|nr:uncharacterized protein LOC114333788 [Diabrotica virgifera virgifera]
MEKTMDTEQETTNTLLKEVLNEIRQTREENKVFRDEILELKKENNKVKTELEETKKKLNILEIRVERCEKEMKQNNLVISGLKINTNDEAALKEKMTNFIKQHLEENTKIEKAVKLGDRTCLLKMESIEEKNKVMKKKSKLRHIKGEKTFISQDMTVLERNIQKEIGAKCKELRDMGRNVKRDYNGLTVDGNEKWRWRKASP